MSKVYVTVATSDELGLPTTNKAIRDCFSRLGLEIGSSMKVVSNLTDSAEDRTGVVILTAYNDATAFSRVRDTTLELLYLSGQTVHPTIKANRIMNGLHRKMARATHGRGIKLNWEVIMKNIPRNVFHSDYDVSSTFYGRIFEIDA
ncbi:hypothetical protein D3C78_17980 [compost metagenome]